VSEEAKRYGKLTVLPTKMNPDLAMGDELLKKTGAGNLFMVFGEPDVKTLYANAGLETAISASPAQFAAYIASEREKWAKVVKAANIRIE